MHKVFAVIKIARQYEGEYVFILPEKAFTSVDESKSKLAAYEYVNTNPIQLGQIFDGPNGEKIECLVERGIHEMEVENLDKGTCTIKDGIINPEKEA